MSGVGISGLIANLPGTVTPYPTQDPNLELGGYRSDVTDIPARNAIPANFRKEGMLVYVKSVKCTYVLSADLATWVFYSSSQELAKQAAWFVATTGNDSNDGKTLGTALLTTDELQQRLCPYGALYRPQQATTITIGSGAFNSALVLNVENTLAGTGIDLLTILGTPVPGAAITLSASVQENPATQTRGELTTLAGTFVAQRRIRVTSGAQIDSIGYSTGLHAGVLNTWVSSFVKYSNNSVTYPAPGDTVIQETFGTTLRSIVINIFGGNNNFIRIQDLAISQSCVLNDFTNTAGQTTGSSIELFGCSLNNGCYLDSNIGSNIIACLIPTGASVRIRSGNWVMLGGSIQGTLYTYPNTSLDTDVNAITIDGGNLVIGGTSASHRIGPGSIRIGGPIQLCNGTATSAIKLASKVVCGAGTPIWSGTIPGASYTSMVELDHGSDFLSSIAFTAFTGAATNAFLIGGIGYSAKQILAPQLSCSVTNFPESAPINGSVYLTAQNSNIAPTNLFSANGRKGGYIFTAYVSVNTVGTSGTPVVNAIFTDDSGVSRTVPVATGPSIVGLGGAGDSTYIELNGASNVQYSVTGIVTPGTLSYSVRVDCRLQSDG